MSNLDIFLLAVALAMDCFAVSVVSGVLLGRFVAKVAFRMGVLFGMFQAMMPFIGWFGMNHFSEYLESVDHWIAFGLLAFLGGKMIKDAFSGDEGHHFVPGSLSNQLMLAVATSIDALAVGISFACLNYRTIGQLVMPLAVIGAVSLVMSLLGNVLGARFGCSISKRLKPEFVGGVILLLIGIKILVSHLWE